MLDLAPLGHNGGPPLDDDWLEAMYQRGGLTPIWPYLGGLTPGAYGTGGGGGGVTYNSDFNWSSGTLPGVVTHGGGTNGRKWNVSANLVTGSSGRITYSASSVGTCLGLMLEAARTNAIFPSQDLGSANFYQDNATTTVNTVVSPDGTTNADTLVGNSVGGGAFSEVSFGNNAGASVTSGNAAISAFYKVAAANPTNFAGFMLFGASGTVGNSDYASSVRNISTGAAGSTGVGVHSGTVLNNGSWNAGNSGWWRQWETGTCTGPYQAIQFQISDAATPTGGYDDFGQPIITGQYSVVMWQWQVETGDFPSSPIVTTSAAVTRSADTATTTDATYIAQRAFLVEARTALGVPASGTQIVAQWDDGTASNYWRVERDTSSKIHVKVVLATVTVADLVSVATVGNDTAFKVAFRIATNDFSMSLNGAAVVTDTVGVPPTPTTGRFGTDTAGANYWFGTLARVRGATTLTDAQLVTEST